MNSLEQLNNFSTDYIDYGDEADYSISLLNLGPQTQTVIEGQSHTAKLGVEIIEIVSGPPTIFLEFDLTAAAGSAQLIWPTLPDGVTATEPEPNIYRLTGVSTLLIWSLVKSPTITLSRDYDQSFTYVGEFNGGQGNVVSWNVALTVTAQLELNTLTPNGIEYDEDAPATFGSENVIQIVDSEEPQSTYTLVGTMSNITAGALTGTIDPGLSYTMAAGVLTISGSRTAINAFLISMVYEPAIDFDQSFNIVWVLTNPVSGLQTTTSPQAITIGATNEEMAEMYLTRNYTSNTYGLLFPSQTPYIPEDVPGALYTITFTLSSPIGVIGLGENFITPVNWNPLLNQYRYESHTRDQVNTLFTQLLFFPYGDLSSSITITYNQIRNGTLQINQQFTLAGSVSNPVRIGGSSVFTLNEDTSFDASPTYIQPNWDTGSYSTVLQTLRSGVVESDVAVFELPDVNWNYIGNAIVNSGVYRNYGPAASLSEFLTIGGVNPAPAKLRGDYTTNFTLNRIFNFGSTFNGTAFIPGGDLFYANADVTIGNVHPEYSLTTIYTYAEDTAVNLAFQITDQATGVTSYTVGFNQSGGINGVFTIDGVDQAPGANWSYTGSKVQINALDVKFNPPGDANTTLLLYYNQSKLQDGATIAQATNVTVTLNNSVQTDEFSLTTSYNYTEDTAVNLVSAITDVSTRATSYTVGFNQSGGINGVFTVDGVDQAPGANWSYTGTKSAINALDVKFNPPGDADTTLFLYYNQSKLQDGLVIVQATNVPVTLNNSVQTSEYSLTTSYNYTEDTYKTLVFDITDVSTRATSYTVGFTNTGLGRFRVNGVPQTLGGNWTVTASKSAINATTVEWVPPADSNSTHSLTYSQSKLQDGLVITQASSVPITFTNTVQSAEYSLTTTYNYVEDGIVTVVDSILDIYPLTGSVEFNNYQVILHQSTPAPESIATQGRFIWYLNSNRTNFNWGEDATVKVSKADANTGYWVYEAPADYQGPIGLTYTLIRNNEGVPTVMANAIPLSLTNTGTNTAYSAETGSISVLREAAPQALTYSIDDVDQYRPDPTSYTVTITQTPVIGQFISSTAPGGWPVTSVNLTGTKTYINNILQNLKFSNAQSSPTSTVLEFSLTRTYRTTQQLASNVNYTIAVRNPIIGDFWHGGYYVGDISTTAGSGVPGYRLLAAPRELYNWGANSWVTLAIAQNNGFPAICGPIEATPGVFTWSETDGALNTSAIVNGQQVDNLSANPTPITDPTQWPALYYVNSLNTAGINGYNDWYMPSWRELEIAVYNCKPDTAPNSTVGNGNVSYSQDYTPWGLSPNPYNVQANPYACPPRTANYTSNTPAQTTAAVFQTGGSQQFNGAYWTNTRMGDQYTNPPWDQNSNVYNAYRGWILSGMPIIQAPGTGNFAHGYFDLDGKRPWADGAGIMVFRKELAST